MPRYYLRVEPNGAYDADGEELSGPEAARSFCDALAHEMRRNPDDASFQRLLIKDEHGAIVHEAPLVLH